jgi:hypothetical protein
MSTELAHRQFVALTPYELPKAQAGVAEWCQAKIHSLAAELREQRSNHRQAQVMHWKRSGWANAIAKTKKLMIYYTKIKQAIQAGYLVVPNFDVNVIAVRTSRTDPISEPDRREATPEVLPPGEGQYVAKRLKGWTEELTHKLTDGSTRTTERFHPMSFSTDLDFPAQLVHPSVLDATNRAMALHLFDRIGLIRKSKRSDPIVVGQIIHPKVTDKWSLRSNPTCVTFFVAWWLDTRDL